jgi:ribosomal protein L22
MATKAKKKVSKKKVTKKACAREKSVSPLDKAILSTLKAYGMAVHIAASMGASLKDIECMAEGGLDMINKHIINNK